MPQYNGERKDILIRQIMEAIAEKNRREIIERLWKGRQVRVRKRLYPAGNVPYRYMRQGKSLFINEEEAQIVTPFYASAGAGKTGKGIANDLNREGLLRRNRKPWIQRQVAKVLEREILYREGVVQYGVTKSFTQSLVSIER